MKKHNNPLLPAAAVAASVLGLAGLAIGVTVSAAYLLKKLSDSNRSQNADKEKQAPASTDGQPTAQAPVKHPSSKPIFKTRREERNYAIRTAEAKLGEIGIRSMISFYPASEDEAPCFGITIVKELPDELKGRDLSDELRSVLYDTFHADSNVGVYVTAYNRYCYYIHSLSFWYWEEELSSIPQNQVQYDHLTPSVEDEAAVGEAPKILVKYSTKESHWLQKKFQTHLDAAIDEGLITQNEDGSYKWLLKNNILFYYWIGRVVYGDYIEKKEDSSYKWCSGKKKGRRPQYVTNVLKRSFPDINLRGVSDNRREYISAEKVPLGFQNIEDVLRKKGYSSSTTSALF